MMTKYDEEERRILWIALNNLQHRGLQEMERLLSLPPESPLYKMVDDWLRQGEQEYHVINTLKVKIFSEEKKQ